MQESLTENELLEIKEYAQKLLYGKYVCAYNKNDEELYRRMLLPKIKEQLEISLNMVGYNLEHSEQDKSIYIQRQDDVVGPRTNLNLLTTQLVYILKRQFLIGVKKLETNKIVYYKWNDLLSDCAPFLKKSNIKTQLIDSLWILKDYGFVSINTPKKDMKKQDLNGDIVIEIYPSINCVCNMDVVKELEEKLSELICNMKETDEMENCNE